MDTEDQQRLLKRLLKHIILMKTFSAKTRCISITQKDKGKRAKDIDHYNDPNEKKVGGDLPNLSRCLRPTGLLDFAELLIRAYELFKTKSTILQRYQQRFQQNFD